MCEIETKKTIGGKERVRVRDSESETAGDIESVGVREGGKETCEVK